MTKDEPQDEFWQNPLVVKTLLFSALYLIISGVVGSWVISTRLLEDFYFSIYTNIGKLLIFSIVVFGLLVRKDKNNILNLPKPITNPLYVVFSLFLTGIFFILGRWLLKYESFSDNALLSIGTHLSLLLIPFFLLIGFFGVNFLKKFFWLFRKESFMCLVLSIVFNVAIFYAWKLWPLFSGGVLMAVSWMISRTSSSVQVYEPRILVVDDFSVSIEEACSGLDSLLLFSALYILIALLDWKKFNKIKLVYMYILAALGLYLVNILRVYVLVLVGVYISRDLSIRLFHTYLGMVFFIVFFFAFWKYFYGFMKK